MDESWLGDIIRGGQIPQKFLLDKVWPKIKIKIVTRYLGCHIWHVRYRLATSDRRLPACAGSCREPPRTAGATETGATVLCHQEHLWVHNVPSVLLKVSAFNSFTPPAAHILPLHGLHEGEDVLELQPVPRDGLQTRASQGKELQARYLLCLAVPPTSCSSRPLSGRAGDLRSIVSSRSWAGSRSTRCLNRGPDHQAGD